MGDITKIPRSNTLKTTLGVAINRLPEALFFSSSSKSSIAALKSSAASTKLNATKKLMAVFMNNIGNKKWVLSPKFYINNVAKLINTPMVKKQMTSLDLSCRNVIVSVLKKFFLLIISYLFILNEFIFCSFYKWLLLN